VKSETTTLSMGNASTSSAAKNASEEVEAVAFPIGGFGSHTDTFCFLSLEAMQPNFVFVIDY